MDLPPNHEWERTLDIDDSDLRLTPIIRPNKNPHILPETTTTTQTLFSSQNHQVDNCVVKPIKIILGPAGIVQTVKLCKIADTQEGAEESVMSTQEYIIKVIKDVGEDDDFTCVPWLSVVEYVNVDEGIMIGCDLTVTLTFLVQSPILFNIHYKVLTEERFANAITIGASLILHNVSVFSPKQSTHHYLNITNKNMVKVFHKDGGSS
ncbi:hypothetical protein Tco_1079149 [Tanacetum coccineum]|uniref:Homologous recombination OB-fold protein OB-fold domain-containing protein n=1 Tax=Tanacetum coccineum TaxID=301880 RepID=A0ABQ5HRX7_9ASTR